MRTRNFGLAMLVMAALLIPGCSTGGGGLKIGLVTDVGTLNDKNFNQYSWEGAQDGATKVGGTAASAVSTTSADIAKNIQSFVDQKYDIIVTVGFAAGNDTVKAAKANPTIKFIGVDQSFICITATGDPDTASRRHVLATRPPSCPNYQGIGWKEQQPGYLAGIVAGSFSQSKVIAAVGGTASVPAVPNYIVGYANGAQVGRPQHPGRRPVRLATARRSGVRRPGRRQGVRTAAPDGEPDRRCHLPGRRPDRQRRSPGRL